MTQITPCLWFDTRAMEAAELYVGVFPGSRIVEHSTYGEAGPGTPGSVMSVVFELGGGNRFMGLNGGPQFAFTEAVSFQVYCDTQEEVDHYWERLSEGGEEGPCGWLKDRFGLSWQIVPRMLLPLLTRHGDGRSQRVMACMLQMRKLDIAALQAAADAA